jgi:hypothetical protein
MRVGTLQERANWFLVGFVFGCIFIITLLLYAKVKAEEKAQTYSYLTGDYSYYIES